MAHTLETRDLPDRLEFHVTERHSPRSLAGRFAIWLAAGSVLLYLGRDDLGTLYLFGIFVSCAMIWDLFWRYRGTNVTFTISERNIATEGHTEDTYSSLNRWRLQAPPLAWKGSRPDTDGPSYASGIYCGADCLLPLVGKEGAGRIIQAIHARFPDTSILSGSGLDDKSDLVLLRLDR